METAKSKKLMKLIGQIAELTSDEGIKTRALQMQERLDVPMSQVLAKVPGDTVTQKVAKLKVSRQTYYYWLRGISRPNHYMAKKLSGLTGFSMEDIRGKTKLSPTSNSPAPPRLTRPRRRRSARLTRRVKRNGNNLPVASGP